MHMFASKHATVQYPENAIVDMLIVECEDVAYLQVFFALCLATLKSCGVLFVSCTSLSAAVSPPHLCSHV